MCLPHGQAASQGCWASDPASRTPPGEDVSPRSRGAPGLCGHSTIGLIVHVLRAAKAAAILRAQDAPRNAAIVSVVAGGARDLTVVFVAGEVVPVHSRELHQP